MCMLMYLHPMPSPAKRPSQLTLGRAFRNRLDHGGRRRVGKRKLARPVTTKRPMHVVMKASKARGEHSMLSPKVVRKIEARLHADAAKNGVRIRGYVNVGNHLHLIVQPRTRAGFQRFLRTFTGVVARMVTGARRGHAFAGGASSGGVYLSNASSGHARDGGLGAASRGHPRSGGQGTGAQARAFWDALAFSRVVTWGRAYEGLKKYLEMNSAESSGGWQARTIVSAALTRYGRLLAEAERAFLAATS